MAEAQSQHTSQHTSQGASGAHRDAPPAAPTPTQQAAPERQAVPATAPSRDVAPYDVAVVGAGVTGCAIARELSRLDVRVVVLEREEDVCCGTSKANSAIVHAGFDAATGSLMARLNVEGSRLMPALCAELGVDYDAIGSLVVCTSDETRPDLEALLARGRANGVPDLRIVEQDELRAMEPNVSDAAVAALWAPTGAIVNPFQLTWSLADSAATNGVEFRFLSPVGRVARDDARDLWRLETPQGPVWSRVVVNAAGVCADELHNQVSADELRITPRRGQYYVLDTTAGSHVRHTIFALPTRLGKGVLVSPTTAGNLLVGPTAEDLDDKADTSTTAEGLAEVAAKCAITVKDVPLREQIRSFSGLRAHQPGHDFVIGEVEGAPGFVDCAAIESPGLSSAPAIGRMVAGIVGAILGDPPAREGWQGTIAPIPCVERMDRTEWAALVRARPDYGRIVCRCRLVSEGQIVDAIHRPVGARSVDAVKRRTEAGMGRCQGGFCSPKVMELLAREVEGLSMGTVTKMGPGSEYVLGANKDRPTGTGAGPAATPSEPAPDPAAPPVTTPKGGDAR